MLEPRAVCSWRGGQPARTDGLLKRDTVIGNDCAKGGAGWDQGNKYLSISLQPLILYQYLPLAQSNQKPMSKKSPVEASCREQLLREPEQRTEGGSGLGGTEIVQHFRRGHFRRLIHDDWRSLEGGRLGILFPGWDLNYYAGRRAKAIQLLPPLLPLSSLA